MVAKGELSEHFSRVIPKDVLLVAQNEFEKQDRAQIYADVQSDIARKLLKLRVSFQENSPAIPDVAYFVDFKLTEANNGHVIVLQGD